jgi:hypothetical protein
MTPNDLKARTKKFAVDVIRFAKAIPKDHINDEIASQLADAATSTAAALWLEILEEAEICAATRTKPLWREADELTRIFVRSRETARARQKREREPQLRAKRPGARSR